jgi:UDP-N-acetylglucosamine 2-epimerase (non-hydrolysing)
MNRQQPAAPGASARIEASRILFVFGTRPEAIKLCPLINELKKTPGRYHVRVCVTAQHRELLDQVLEAFSVTSDHDLDIMAPGQSLLQSSARILSGLDPVLEAENPALVLVQGDTTTALCGALAAFYRQIPVGHVEAGLRTGDVAAPFPEEINRVLVTRLARLHFAATPWAASNLRAEAVPDEHITITGNTGIDAALYVSGRLERGELRGGEWPWLDPGRRLILVTAHRRESFGGGMERICDALARLALRPDVQITYPVHPNPNVRGPVESRLENLENVFLIDPLPYVPFVDLMRRASILLTDSGGIQEEGPSLGKPVLVMREKTERPEAVEAGTAILVGTDPDRIVAEAGRLLDDEKSYRRMALVHNPYGDGTACAQIAKAIGLFLKG